MASVWIRTRATSSGAKRHLVYYRVAGRESGIGYAGSFKTQREAKLRADYVRGEFAATTGTRLAGSRAAEALRDARRGVERWRASRVDVTESTRTLHRVALNRVTKVLGERRVDEITEADVVVLVTTLAEAGASARRSASR